MDAALRKKIDRFLRFKLPLFVYSLFFRKRKEFTGIKSIKRVLFLRPGKLGDMVVTTPIFHLIKEKFPNVHTTVLCSKNNETVIRSCIHINYKKVVEFNSLSSIIALIQELRREPADLFIDCTPGFSRTGLLIARLSSGPRTKIIGMHKGDFSKFYDATIDPDNLHIIDRNVKLLEMGINCKFDDFIRPRICMTSVHKRDADNFLSVKSLSGRKFLGINLSAGSPARQWNLENYRKLVQFIRGCDDFNRTAILLFSVGSQRQWARRLSEEFRYVHEVPLWDLLTTSALIAKIQLLFSPDTSLIHIAAAFDIPVVGIYCAAGENLARWRARVSKSRECVAEDNRGINSLTPESVFENIKEIFIPGKVSV